MKLSVFVLSLVLTVGLSQANYCANGEFDQWSGGTPVGWSKWAGNWWQEGSNSVCVLGWANNAVLGQDTGHAATANTVYTLTARVQSRHESGGQAEGVQLILQDGSWADIARNDFWFSDLGDAAGQTGPWREVSISIDTGVLTHLVGQTLKAAIALRQDGRWRPYDNLYIDTITLEKTNVNRRVMINPLSLTVTENVDPVGSYEVRLNWADGFAPTANVQVSAAPGTGGPAVSLNGSPAGQAATLVFTATEGYDNPQTITVTAVEDTQKTGQRLVGISHTISSADAGWNALPLSEVTVRVLDDELLPNTTALERWRGQRFGMFIHWGPVSQTGGEISWSRDSYGRAAYDQLYTTFNPVKFNAQQWVALAKAAGMKYLVLTTKHHDGFCLYDSAYTTYDMMSTPFGRDVTKELADECVAQGIDFCAYHSIPDWKYTDNPLSSYVPYLHNQVTEVITKYNPAIVWFDNWENAVAGWDTAHGFDLYNLCRNTKAQMLVNDRVYAAYLPADPQYPGDYKTPEQKVGVFNDQFPWESCITIANQWSWKPNDPVKSLKQCIQTLASCAGGDGNLLLNIGPKSDGSIEPQQTLRLLEIGQWLNTNNNAEAIYETRGGPVSPQSWGVMTHRGNRFYAHVWGKNWLGSHGTAAQSTTYPGSYEAFRAVDSNVDTFNHTNANDTTPTWQIRTDASYHFTKIELVSRPTLEYRASDLVVEIMDFTGNVTAQFALGSGGTMKFRTETLNPGNAMNNPTMITIDLVARTGGPVNGNLIRVTKIAGAERYLHLTEVQAYATNQPGTGQQITIPAMSPYVVQSAFLLANPSVTVPFTQVGQNVTLDMTGIAEDPISTIVAIDVVSASDYMTLTEPTDRAVFQRRADNLADVPVAGNYSGTFTRIEARAIVMDGFTGTATDWQVVDAAPAGGSFSGVLTVEAGGWYSIQARGFNGSAYSPVTSVDKVGVGEVFITAGQSNSANYGSPAMTPAQDTVSAWTGSGWRHAYDPQPNADGTGGSPWSRLGDMLVERFGCPVAFLSNGVGSTRVDQWLPGTACYSKIQASITAAGANGFRAILWHQGESDNLASTAAAAYASRINSIIAQTRIDAGWDVPWGVALASYHPSGTTTQAAQVRSGQSQVIDGDALVFEGADTDEFQLLGYLHDGVHFDEAGLNNHAKLWKNSILKHLFPCDFEPDLDNDLTDIVFLANCWLDSDSTTTCDEADLLKDNLINLEDFSVCTEQWLK